MRATALLALDISAAFDAVDHCILCDRARTVFGIDGLALDWLRSFVTDRAQYVAVGTERSEVNVCNSGVPQGSILGPLCFAMYVSPIDDVISCHKMRYHQYADDLQLYVAMVPSSFGDLSSVVNCVNDVSRWFLENALLLNPNKTEAVVFGTRQRLQQIDRSHGINLAGSTVQFAEAVKLLGVTLDSTLSFDRYITEISRNCCFHIRALRHIRPLLTLDAAKSIAVCLTGARLDYCNSLLYGTTQCNIDRLQKLQNSLARAVFQAPWSTSAAELRKSLHWLPIKERITYKTALITFKVRRSGLPCYLHDMIDDYKPVRTLRSSDEQLLHQPMAKISFESRAFPIAAPAVWNSLSRDTRTATTVNSFKTRLKTELFSTAYCD